MTRRYLSLVFRILFDEELDLLDKQDRKEYTSVDFIDVHERRK
ncbi:MAG: hypothetical protein ABR911_02650 [Syntrophales bacterium]